MDLLSGLSWAPHGAVRCTYWRWSKIHMMELKPSAEVQFDVRKLHYPTRAGPNYVSSYCQLKSFVMERLKTLPHLIIPLGALIFSRILCSSYSCVGLFCNVWFYPVMCIQTCVDLMVKKGYCVVHFHFSVIIILKCSQSNWQIHLVLYHSVLLGLW